MLRIFCTLQLLYMFQVLKVATACIIIVMYVDNNGVRHNCHELLPEFQSDVAKDGRIDLHLEGDMSSFLSVCISIIPKQERSPLIRKLTSIPCSLNTI